jgi:hypothetical protein
MYICPLFCLPNELLELDAPVASLFTMESVGASVVGVRTTNPESPEESSGETDDGSVDDDLGSAMERGNAMKLTRRGGSLATSRPKPPSVLDMAGAVMTGESSVAPR